MFPPLAEMDLDISTKLCFPGDAEWPAQSRYRPDTSGTIPLQPGSSTGSSSEPLSDCPSLPWFYDPTERIKRRSVWGTEMIQWMTHQGTRAEGQEITKKNRQILTLAEVKQKNSQEAHQ